MDLTVHLAYLCVLKWKCRLAELKDDCSLELERHWKWWGIDYKDAEEVRFFLEDYEI